MTGPGLDQDQQKFVDLGLIRICQLWQYFVKIKVKQTHPRHESLGCSHSYQQIFAVKSDNPMVSKTLKRLSFFKVVSIS